MTKRLGAITDAAFAFAVTLLFIDAQRSPEIDGETRVSVRGEAVIWLMLVATGNLSILMTFFRATADFAPMIYATLPVSSGLFVWNYDWGGRGATGSREL